MNTLLLATKLSLPPLRPDLVSRPRLTQRLSAGLHRKLSLISAPAGFGKTTLLSEWIHHRGEVSASTPHSRDATASGELGKAGTSPLQVAWLSLDEADNDPARFLARFIAALQTVAGHLGQGLLATLQSPGAINVESILTALLNEITAFSDNPSTAPSILPAVAEQGSGRRLVLVLDDYHVVESLQVDDALTFTLDHLPPHMHLVIVSRIDPSLPLSRLRAGDQMTEVREDDLRFTRDEATTFLGKVMGLDLSAENVAALETRTEGWIAGLQLAALSMQGLERGGDITDFVNSFTGSDRYIHDYLADEVLQRRPTGTRDFLLQTSILNRLSGPSADWR